jgi:predicted Zn-dependent protease
MSGHGGATVRSGDLFPPLLSWRGMRIALATAVIALLPAVAHADRATARARYEAGRELAAAGDASGALERYQQALVEDPDYLPAVDAAAEAWVAAGDLERVVAALTRVTARHPSHASAWYSLAYAYRRSGKPALAIDCYQIYAGLRVGDPDPHFGIAMAALDLGDHAQAIAALRRYLRLEHRPERADFVARARAELSRLGVDPAEPAAGDSPPATTSEQVAALLASGRVSSAAALLDRAGDDVSPAERWRLRADIYAACGQPRRARQAASLALALGGLDPVLATSFARQARAAGHAAAAAYFEALAAGTAPAR